MKSKNIFPGRKTVGDLSENGSFPVVRIRNGYSVDECFRIVVGGIQQPALNRFFFQTEITAQKEIAVFTVHDPILRGPDHFSLKISAFGNGLREVLEFRFDSRPLRSIQLPGDRRERSGAGLETEFGNFNLPSRAVGGIEAKLSNQSSFKPARRIDQILFRYRDGMPLSIGLKRGKNPFLPIRKILLVMRVIELTARCSGSFGPVMVDEGSASCGIKRHPGKDQLGVLADFRYCHMLDGCLAFDVFQGFPAGKLIGAVPDRRFGGGNGHREGEKEEDCFFHGFSLSAESGSISL